MPLSCSTSAISGADGLIQFKPAGTSACLRDNADFSAGTSIVVPANSDFKTGDPVIFSLEGSGKLDTALTAGTTYYIVKVGTGSIDVSATKGGTAITMNGDGGLGGPSGGIVSALTLPTLPTTSGGSYTGTSFTGLAVTGGGGSGLTVDATITANEVSAIVLNAGGTGYTAGDSLVIDGADLGGTSGTDDITITVGTASAITGGGDTPGAANHIALGYATFDAICSVTEWSLDLSRESIDTTTLPCKVGAGGSKYASFRTTTGGFASGEGSMTVLFSADQSSLANRLMANAMLKDSTADVKLYVNAVSSGATIDDTASSYFEGQVSLQGFSVSVNIDDAVAAEISFTLSAQPKAIFGVKLD